MNATCLESYFYELNSGIWVLSSNILYQKRNTFSFSGARHHSGPLLLLLLSLASSEGGQLLCVMETDQDDVGDDESSHHHNEHHHHELNNDKKISKRINEELALSAIHQKNVESHWRQVLRKEKFQELHNDIDSLQQYHQQNIQQKKHVLESIQNETAILQQLYHGAMVANINHMERMIGIHDEQVVLVEKSFRERLVSMQAEFQDDVERITTQYDKENDVVQQCINIHHEKEQRRNELLQLEQQRELDEIETRHKENNTSIKRHLDSAVKHFQEQFEHTHEEYTQRNHVTKKVYEELKLKDDEVKKKIRQTTRRADHIQSKVQQTQLLAEKEKVQRRDGHQVLLERKVRALETFQLIKDDMTKFRKNQQEKLIVLSRRANERKNSLQKQCDVAERVKKIADRCHQLETSREQFATILRELSSSSSSHHANAVGVAAVEQDSSVHTEASTLVAQQKKAASKSIAIASSEPNKKERALLWDTTQRFWDKYNVAQVDVLMLQKRIAELKRKEVDLQNKLTMCRNGVTVNDDVLKERNPLLVINGKMNMNALVPETTEKTTKKRLTVVEGNVVMRQLKGRGCPQIR